MTAVLFVFSFPFMMIRIVIITQYFVVPLFLFVVVISINSEGRHKEKGCGKHADHYEH
jgi:hypothetical protein